MLKPKEVAKIKKTLDGVKNPLFLFHDDPDGLASYLLCYRYLREGTGYPIKARPCVTKSYVARVEEQRPDHIFILDIALVDQEFVDEAKTPITWIDHHEMQDVQGVNYFNPQRYGVNIPTPALIWQVIGEKVPKDLWLAVAGSIGDWHFPSFAKPFQEAYPEILPPTCTTVQEALFNTKLGDLVRVFAFNIKGSLSQVKKSLKAFYSIEDPYEILNQQTPAGEYLWERYEKINKQYEYLKKQALKKKPKGKLLVHIYESDKLSVTKDLANELLYRFKDKVILLGRERGGQVRFSLRSPPEINLKPAFEKAMSGIEGHGGGHEQAHGGSVPKEDFKEFVSRLRKELK